MTGPRRVAAIDVGTNSIRLIIAELRPDRSFRVLDDEKVVTRLGRGLTREPRLSEKAIAKSIKAIAHLRTIAEGFDVEVLRAGATSAVREADNGDAFLERVRTETGVPIEVVTAEKEGRLAFLSVANAFDLRTLSTAVVDVGGGSTEIVLASGTVIERIYPLRIGAVRLTERFGLDAALTPPRFDDLQRFIRRTMRRHVGKAPFVPHLVIGTGGTFTNLAAISMHRGLNEVESGVLPFAVRGYEMQRSEVRHVLHHLAKMTPAERARVPGLNPDRADIIVGGLAIVDGVLAHLGVNRLRVHDQGIRAGLLYDLMDELMPPAAARRAAEDRQRSVRTFLAACKQEPRHAEHVATLAAQLFDGLAAAQGDDAASWATAGNRELLHAAALLHDVGYLINYTKHHKHTYHLILHSDLAGFTQRDLEIIANIARYHRGAKPKVKHGNYARLDAADRDLVRRLAAILRIAVGLDRSHAQIVSSIGVVCTDGTAVFEVRAPREPGVELWGARRKMKLFESAFGIKPSLHWAPTPDAAATNGAATLRPRSTG